MVYDRGDTYEKSRNLCVFHLVRKFQAREWGAHALRDDGKRDARRDCEDVVKEYRVFNEYGVVGHDCSNFGEC